MRNYLKLLKQWVEVYLDCGSRACGLSGNSACYSDSSGFLTDGAVGNTVRIGGGSWTRWDVSTAPDISLG